MVERTLLESMAALSVDVNGLIIPGGSAQKVLARHAFNLIVHNDHETYKVSLMGSATAVRFKDKFLLLSTQHQLKGVNPEKIGMMKDDGSFLVTSGGFRSYKVSTETDAFDIVSFDFSNPVAEHPDLKKRFFELVDVPPDIPTVNIMAFLLTGFPSEKQTYELEDRNHLGVAKLNIVCLPDGQPSDPALLRVRAQDPLKISPDGMSGGSVIPPILEGIWRRTYAAIWVSICRFSFWAGVNPPRPMLGRSLL